MQKRLRITKVSTKEEGKFFVRQEEKKRNEKKGKGKKQKKQLLLSISVFLETFGYVRIRSGSQIVLSLLLLLLVTPRNEHLLTQLQSIGIINTGRVFKVKYKYNESRRPQVKRRQIS